MSRKCIQIFTISLSVFSSVIGQKPQEDTIKNYLKPWCVMQNTTIKELKEKFSDSEEGAYNFITEFSHASREVFDKQNYRHSHIIEAQILLGLIYIANEHCKSKGLPYSTKDCIEMLDEMSIIKKKLTEEEQKYLKEVHDKEIVVDSNSESEEE
jgi:hypothetical protein